MIVLVIVAALVIAAMVATHIVVTHRQAEFFMARLKEQDEAAEARAVALYKQQKAANRATTAEVSAAAETVRHLHADATLMHQRTDALARDVKAGSS